MKILYDHQIFSISGYGGALRYFCELIKRLAQMKDSDVNVFLGFFISEYGLENYRNYFNSFSGKKHKPYPYSKLFFLFLNKFLFKNFSKKISANIYHQTYYDIINMNNRAKRIVTVLDMMHELYPESFSKFDNTRIQKKQAVKTADGIICISHSTKKDLMEILKVPEDKIRVIHLGNSLSVETSGKPLVQPPYLLYIAKRIGYKNFNMLVEAFAKIKNNYPELKIVCSGGGDFNSEEIKTFESLNVRKKIIYVNANDTTLANLYKYAEVFVYPSKYEGFGVSLLEAMNMKCPVIASNISSIPEILGDAGLYINPDEPEDLGNKIELLLNDRGLRSDLIQKGLIQKENFNWDKCASETLNYYREISGN